MCAQVPGLGTIVEALALGLADTLASVAIGAGLLLALGASFYFSFALEATPMPRQHGLLDGIMHARARVRVLTR